MGLSQSSEVSEGGTYGYHVHGVRLQNDWVSFEFEAAFNVTAAYHEMLLYANS